MVRRLAMGILPEPYDPASGVEGLGCRFSGLKLRP